MTLERRTRNSRRGGRQHTAAHPPRGLLYGSVPLYMQVEQAISQAIESGEFRPGEELPAEGQLCDRYGVSRITVRQAVSELLREGVVERRRPRGPLLVSRPRIPRELSELRGPFVEEILAGGVRRQTRVLAARVESASPLVAGFLGVAPGTDVYLIERLHSGDDEALAHQQSWLPQDLLPGLLEHDLTTSLQRLCEIHYGQTPVRKTQRIGARAASNEEAALLNLARKGPILEIERTIAREDGRILEHTRYALRPDRFTIVSEIERLPETTVNGDQNVA